MGVTVIARHTDGGMIATAAANITIEKWNASISGLVMHVENVSAKASRRQSVLIATQCGVMVTVSVSVKVPGASGRRARRPVSPIRRDCR